VQTLVIRNYKEVVMPTFILRPGVAILTFIIGIGANAFISRIADRFISERSTVSSRTENHWQGSWFSMGERHWRELVVTVADDRTVYLGSHEAGTLDDLGPLRERLTRLLAWRTERGCPGHAGTVYVKTSASVLPNELENLTETIKSAGAMQVVTIKVPSGYSE
jgi:hypothetical protein